MTLHYAKLAEHEIRLIVIEPKREDDSTIRCTLKHLSLNDTARDPILSSNQDRIPFEGLQQDAFDEYLNVHSMPREGFAIKHKFPRLKKLFGKKRAVNVETDPINSPHEHNFTIVAGTPSYEDVKLRPKGLPRDWRNRYKWGDYVALSYCWGDPDDTMEIIISNGEQVHDSTGVRHRVTRNLFDALLHLREAKMFAGPLMLWIDALCINQGDIQERLHLCTRMDKIYHEAGNTLVWLGPEKTYGTTRKGSNHILENAETPFGSSTAIGYLQWMSTFYRTEILEYLDHSRDVIQAAQFRETANFELRRSFRMFTSAVQEEFEFIIEEYGWLSLLFFFDNPYWRRLWIIQELVMSTEKAVVVCGNQFTQWRHVRDGALIIAAVYDLVSNKVAAFAKSRGINLPDLSNRSVEQVASIAELGIHANRKVLPDISTYMLSFSSRPGPAELPTQKGTGLRQILALASQAYCSRPGDRVLGMLCIPPLHPRSGFLPAPNTSLRALYIGFAEHLMVSGRPPSNDFSARTETTTIRDGGRIIATTHTETYTSNVSLEHLSLIDGFEDELELPSWVPNFAKPEWRKTFLFLGPWYASGMASSPDNFRQGVPTPSRPNISVPGARPLGLRAVHIDIIAGLGAIQSLQEQKMITKDDEDPGNSITSLLWNVEMPLGIPRVKEIDCYQKGVVQPSGRIQPPSEPYIQMALPRILTGMTDLNGRVIDGESLLRKISGQEWKTDAELWNWDFINSSKDLMIGEKPLGEYFDCTKTCTSETPIDTAGQATDPIAVDIAMNSMAAKTKCRRILLTARRGLLGLGPMAMGCGDSIVILVGHNVPVAIRKTSIVEGQQLWRLIGECFIPGLMEGEAANSGTLLRMSEELIFV